jgi:phosphohistidine phosphatase
MELILWRHAEAEDGIGIADSERALTKKGLRQAERMAGWLRPRLDGDWRVLVSPSKGISFDVTAEVGTGADSERVLRVSGWPTAQKVLVVGHQPTLGNVAAELLGGRGDVAFRKGAVWWFATRSRDGSDETVLRAVMNPEMLDS